MAVREDESRERSRHAAEHLSLLRKLALSPLKCALPATVGIEAKRLKCGWDETSLARVHTAYGDCPGATPCVYLRTADLMEVGRLSTLIHGHIPRDAWSRLSLL